VDAKEFVLEICELLMESVVKESRSCTKGAGPEKLVARVNEGVPVGLIELLELLQEFTVLPMFEYTTFCKLLLSAIFAQ